MLPQRKRPMTMLTTVTFKSFLQPRFTVQLLTSVDPLPHNLRVRVRVRSFKPLPLPPRSHRDLIRISFFYRSLRQDVYTSGLFVPRKRGPYG
jgi:hypothetical protein